MRTSDYFTRSDTAIAAVRICQYARYYPRVKLRVDNLRVTEYRVLFSSGTPGSAKIIAEKVNLGERKVWFYDAENHLVAVYQWDKLIGLDVVGSASEQSFTDSLLHTRRPSSDTERAQAIEERPQEATGSHQAISARRRDEG